MEACNEAESMVEELSTVCNEATKSTLEKTEALEKHMKTVTVNVDGS